MAKITLGLAGDVMIGRLVDDRLCTTSPETIWGDMLSLLRSSDFNLINLEAALTKSEEEVFKAFNFKSHPDHVKSLLEANITAVHLANNHVLDFAEKGLAETIETLDHVGIAHVGAGRTEEEAKKPYITTVKGIKLGVLGYTDNEPGWVARRDCPGTQYLEIGEDESWREEIEALRPQVDYLIVSLHWGPNMRERPTRRFRKFAHDLVDAGVDLIHGHSSHVFQGIEVYNDKLILYDTGDFVDDYAVDPYLRNDRTFFYQIEIDEEGFQKLRCLPAHIENCQVNRADGNEGAKILKRLRQLSKELGTELHEEEGSLVLTR